MGNKNVLEADGGGGCSVDVLNALERENMLEMAHFMLFFTIVKTEIGGREGGGGRSAAGSRPVDGGRGLCPRRSCHPAIESEHLSLVCTT